MSSTYCHRIRGTVRTGVLLGLSFGAFSVIADDFYWVGGNPWGDFEDPVCWRIGHDASGAETDRAPGADDWFYLGSDYSRTFYLRIGDDHTIKGLNGNTQYGINKMQLAAKDGTQGGTLTIAESFTNMYVQPTLGDNVKLVLAATSASRLGASAARSLFTLNGTSALDFLGTIRINNARVDVGANATFTLDPVWIGWDYAANNKGDYHANEGFYNSGTMNMPHGFAFQEPALQPGATTFYEDYRSSPPVLHFVQQGGTLTTGGDITSATTSKWNYYDASTKVTYYNLHATTEFVLAGGEFAANADVTFAGFDSVSMPEGSAVRVTVAAGKTVDFSKMAFGADAALTLGGTGAVRLGEGIPASLVLEAGSKLVLSGTDAHLGNITIAEGASVSAALDGRNDFSVSVADETVRQTLFDGFTVPDGWEKKLIGDTIVIHVTQGLTYHWNHGSDGTAYKYRDVNQWYLLGENDEHVVPADPPGHRDLLRENDSYDFTRTFDGEGRVCAINGFDYTDIKATYGHRDFHFRNGTFVLAGYGYHRRILGYVENGAKLVLAASSTARFGWGGADNSYTVKTGSMLEAQGAIEVESTFRFINEANGTTVIAPLSFLYKANANGPYSCFENAGEMSFPDGIAFTDENGRATSPSTKPLEVNFVQNGGTMRFGGALSAQQTIEDVYSFVLNGGTLAVDADLSMGFFATVGMTTENAAATIEVADGKTLDWANATFAAGTSLAKTGPGTLELGDAPASLTVSEGTLRAVKDGVAFGTVALAPGATLALKATGLEMNDVSGFEDAAFAVDTTGLKGTKVILTSTNAEFLAAILAKATVTGEKEIMVDGNRLLCRGPGLTLILR